MKKRVNISTILVLLLVISNITLLFKIKKYDQIISYTKMSNLGEVNSLKLRKSYLPGDLPLVPMQNGMNNILNKQISKQGLTLMILFDPSGCGSCLNEKVMWNDIYASTGVDVIGISNHPYRNELSKYLKDAGIKIKVYQDSTGVLNSWFMPNKLPVKLLLQNEQVVFADYVRDSPESRNQFIDFINLYKKYESEDSTSN